MKTLWLPVCLALVISGAAARVLEERTVHLGVAGQPEWEEFAGAAPHGTELRLTFTAAANDREHTLFVRQRNVKATWLVTINGERIGTLETLTQPLVRALPVRAGLLREGENTLVIARAPNRMVDDIVVGEIVLEARSRAEALSEATLDVSVADAQTGKALPCRLTLVDTAQALAPLRVDLSPRVAVRTGVVYTSDGRARVQVRAGRYVLYASRGFEYGVASESLDIAAGEVKPLTLSIACEVPTPGWVACDTHIHTLTHSRHGDATIDERAVTIAGEGIEVAVATDHNHHTDYAEAAERSATQPHFRAVVGNEVSTKVGHFNAFPVLPGAALPDAQLTDWTALLRDIRGKTGAQVVTLNHPRDVHQNFTPLGPEVFDAGTGRFLATPSFDVDAIEVVTSAAMQSDVYQLYRDWFALLNGGYRVAAVGASDTHNVSEFILGQARTYAAVRNDGVAEVQLEDVWTSFRSGRLLVSMGLLADLEVNGRFGVGDLVTGVEDELSVTVQVLGPAWATADRVELFANGIKVREASIESGTGAEKARVRWRLPKPRHDVHLVAIATGPGVTAPFWEIPRPYQPSARVFTSRVIGSTNAVWIDADGDGRFSSAREIATRAVAQAAGDRALLARLVAGHDAAVRVQVDDLLRATP
jgi:hypothetical protein